MPFSYTDCADYLFVDRSAMMRELGRMKEEGLIRTEGKRIWLEEKKLRRRYQGEGKIKKQQLLLIEFAQM